MESHAGSATVFLLSPANCAGKRGQLLLRPEADFELARALRNGGAPLGEVYAFMSSLYFRGKLAYAARFARPLAGAGSSTWVITPGRGLCPTSHVVTLNELQSVATIDVDARNALYTAPLRRDAADIARLAPAECRFVLLGSIATSKYVEPLLDVFGPRLMFPCAFVGRGDMSRGGLMLRCAQEGTELDYAPVHSSVLHGERPARLGPRRTP